MAIFYMDVRNVNKATQSAVAKAAYISGEVLKSERDESIKKYPRSEAPVSFILAPDHAPAFVKDRETLWNEAEKIERAYNARVAKEVVFALPIELTKEQQIELTKDYVQENFVDKGMVADVNIHYDKYENPHVHVLLTVRPFDEKGNWANKSKKEYVKDQEGKFVFNENGTKKTKRIDLTEGWNDRDTLISWRENLAEKINESLLENGFSEKVSHLSNESLGKDEIARKRLNRTEYEIENKHREFCEASNIEYVPVTMYGKINLDIEKFNKEIYTIDNEIEKLKLEKLNITVDKNIVITLLDIKKESDSKHSEELQKGYEFIAKRLKLDVSQINYSSTIKLATQLKNWERKLNGEMRLLNSKVSRLEKIEATLNAKGDLKEFGIGNRDLNSYRENLINEIKENKLLLENERLQLFEAKKYLNQVEKSEYQTLFKQFTTVHPEYKDIVKFKTGENGKLMFDSLSKFIQTLEKNAIPEFEFNSLKETDVHKLRTQISANLDNASHIIPSYFSLTKQMNAIKVDIENAIINNSDSQTFEKLSKKQFAVMEHYDYVVKEYKSIQDKMNEQLKEIYGVDLSELKPKSKQELLTAFIDDREPKDLTQYLQNNPEYTQQVESGKGGLLEAMLTVAIMPEHNKNKYDDENKKRKKNGFEKGNW